MTEHIRHRHNSETYTIDPHAGETPAQLSPQILQMVNGSIIDRYRLPHNPEVIPSHPLRVHSEPKGDRTVVTLYFERTQFRRY